MFAAAQDGIDTFDSDSSNILLNLLQRMLSVVSTRANDVANYPNVRGLALWSMNVGSPFAASLSMELIQESTKAQM